MAIGQVRYNNYAGQYNTYRPSPESFGASVGRSLSGLGTALENYQAAQQSIIDAEGVRARKKEGYETAIRYQRESYEWERRQIERRQRAAANGESSVQATYEGTQRDWEDFLSTVPDHLLHVYEEKFEAWRTGQMLEAFTYDGKVAEEQTRLDIEQESNRLAGDLHSGNITFAEAEAAIDLIFAESLLPDIEKQDLRNSTLAFLRGAEFRHEAAQLRAGIDYFSGMTPGELSFASAVIAAESNGQWNIMWGQTYFEDFSDHPRKVNCVDVPGRGNVCSSAAGMFQFLASTWDEVAGKLGLTDFSPENQVRAFLYYAEESYNREMPLGLTFAEAVESNDPAVILSIKHALGSKWEGIDANHMSDAQFLKLFTGDPSIELTMGVPNIWDDERFRDMPYDTRLQLTRQADSDAKSIRAQLQADAKKARESQLDTFYVGLNQGKIGGNEIESAIAGGFLQTAEEIEKAWKHEKIFRETGSARAEVAGSGPLNSQRHGEVVNEFVDLGRVRGGDTDYVDRELMSFVDRGGFIPSDAANVLKGMALGANPKERAFAYTALAKIHNRNPNALDITYGEGGGRFTEQVEFFAQGNRYFGSPEETLSTMDWMYDPGNKALLEARTAEARKQLASHTPKEISNRVFDSYLTLQPTPPTTLEQSHALQREYNEAYTRGYEMTGDDSFAKEWAKEQMLKTWGVNNLNNTRQIAKYPISKFYDEEIVNWMLTDYLRDNGLDKDTPIMVAPTDNTEFFGHLWRADPTAAGHNAPYHVFMQDLNGTWVPIAGEFGQEWTFDGGIDKGLNPEPRLWKVNEYPEKYQELAASKIVSENAKAKLSAYKSEFNRLTRQQRASVGQASAGTPLTAEEEQRLETLPGLIEDARTAATMTSEQEFEAEAERLRNVVTPDGAVVKNMTANEILAHLNTLRMGDRSMSFVEEQAWLRLWAEKLQEESGE